MIDKILSPDLEAIIKNNPGQFENCYNVSQLVSITFKLYIIANDLNFIHFFKIF